MKSFNIAGRRWVAAAGLAVAAGLAAGFNSTFVSTDTAFGGNGAASVPGYVVTDLNGNGDHGVDIVTGSDDSLYSLGYQCTLVSGQPYSCQFGATGTGAVANVVTHHAAANGQLDASFGSNGLLTLSDASVPFSDGSAGAIALAVDDVHRFIYLAGYIHPGNGVCQIQVARFTFAGTLDTSYGNNGLSDIIPTRGNTVPIGKMVLDPQLNLYINGADTLQSNGVTTTYGSFVARLNPAGHLDSSFNAAGATPGFLSYTMGACDSSSGNLSLGTAAIYLPGSAQISCSANKVAALARVLLNGTLDPAFGSNGVATFPALSTDLNGDSGLAAQEQPNLEVAFVFGTQYMAGFNGHELMLQSNGSVDTATAEVSGNYTPADSRFQLDGGRVYQRNGALVLNGLFQTTAADSDLGLTRLGCDPAFVHAPPSFGGAAGSPGSCASVPSSSVGGGDAAGGSGGGGAAAPAALAALALAAWRRRRRARR
jgi:uncharacterized delta-60 repeat protein